MFTRGGFYIMGIVGAAVYYVQQVSTFWGGVAGVVKSFFWPAILIYKLFVYLKV